jgi:hypothetical protein
LRNNQVWSHSASGSSRGSQLESRDNKTGGTRAAHYLGALHAQKDGPTPVPCRKPILERFYHAYPPRPLPSAPPRERKETSVGSKEGDGRACACRRRGPWKRPALTRSCPVCESEHAKKDSPNVHRLLLLMYFEAGQNTFFPALGPTIRGVAAQRGCGRERRCSGQRVACC